MTLNEIRMRRILLTLGELHKKLDDLTLTKKGISVSLISREDIEFLRAGLDKITDNLEQMMR